MPLSNIIVLIVFILGCEGAGVLGALTTNTGQSPWYQALNKPAFNPPGWVFGPVWTLLYLLMGIAAFLVWRQGWHRPEVRIALVLFVIQLALNAAWTPVFFGAHSIGGALAIIVAMLIFIAATMVAFWPVSTAASLLMLPYLLWVVFATVLNASIYMRNRAGMVGA